MLPAIASGSSPNARSRSDSTKKPGMVPAPPEMSRRASPAAPAATNRRMNKATELALAHTAREEETARTSICLQEATEQNRIFSLLQQHTNDTQLQQSRETLAKLGGLLNICRDQSERYESLHSGVEASRSDTRTVTNRVEQFFTFLNSDEKKRMDQLQLEIALCKTRLVDQTEEMARQHAESQALRSTLSRRMLRTAAENDVMRDEVRREMARAQLDVEALKKALIERIDTAVLNFHKPVYTTALRELQAQVSKTQEAVQAQADELRRLAMSIGAQDPLKDEGDSAQTMHSNFPHLYRKELQQLSREQLINMLDVVSFEDGVVDAVGRSLFARRGVHHLGVFN